MKKLLLALLISLPAYLSAQTISESHLKAAQELIEVSGVKDGFDDIITTTMATQAKSLPEDKREKFMEVMKQFMAKYFNYEILKPELSKIYAEEFTEAELKEVTKFYSSPTGKKMATKLPSLQQKGAEMGMKAVQAHQSELQEMMMKAFQQ